MINSGSQRYSLLALKDMHLAFKDIFFWQSKIHTSGCKSYAHLTLKAMHLWLSKICTSGSQRYAPLAVKDVHLLLSKICIYPSLQATSQAKLTR